MALRYLLDTNTVSYHVRRSSPALQKRLKQTRASSVALSVVTEMEIRKAGYREGLDSERLSLSSHLIAACAAALAAEASARGRPTWVGRARPPAHLYDFAC
ncbi:MAG TPA: hypothetical protein VGB99_09750 [Acidobacteriota bacterium]